MSTLYGYPLSEKSLELNVLSDMLADVQEWFGQKSFLYGFSIRQERDYGLDSSISIPGNPQFLAFQFKRAYVSRGKRYFFHINNNYPHCDQHNFLLATALHCYPNRAVLYALPAIANMFDLADASPDFVEATRFIDPVPIGRIDDGRRHNIIVDISSNTYTMQSSFGHRELNLYTWDDLAHGIQSERFGSSISEFVERLRAAPKESIGLRTKDEPRKLSFRSLIILKQRLPSTS